jgi:tetratricopeptide (TPR) repeat protein
VPDADLDAALDAEPAARTLFDALDAAIAMAPEWPEGWSAKARALYRLGRREDAVAVFDTALEQIGAEPALLLDKAGFHLWQGDFARARDTFGRLVSLQPQSTEGWLGKGWSLLNEGRAEQALECARRVIMVDKQSMAGHRLCGDSLLQLGRWAELFDVFVEAENHDSRQFDASNWAARGDQFQQNQQPEFALQAYQRAITMDNKNHQGWNGKGEMAKGRGDFEIDLEAMNN